MCRWVAYYGNLIRPELLLYETRQLARGPEPPRSHGGRAARTPTGFGLGWYGEREQPGPLSQREAGVGRPQPARARQASSSPLFLAHIRAATGTPVEETNCHPFRHGRWLFMHNGFIDGYLAQRRELLLAVDPSLFPGIEGTTDSELMFHLALTFGLQEDPLGGARAMAGFVEADRARARRGRAAADDDRGQ